MNMFNSVWAEVYRLAEKRLCRIKFEHPESLNNFANKLIRNTVENK